MPVRILANRNSIHIHVLSPQVFTQPAGVIKCAGAPQKIMWMAWDRYRKSGRGSNVKVDFFTGMPTMFSVKKVCPQLPLRTGVFRKVIVL